MTANTSLLLSNPDFPSRLASLKAYLRAQDRFRDYDFDGSNLSVFLEVLAYNSYQDSFLASMAATEMFKDTAQLKSSVISRAKELGYVPRSKRSSSAYVDIEITPTNSPATITIPKGQSFNSVVGTRAFTFSTENAIVVFPDSEGRYRAANTRVYEGFYVTEQFEYDASISNPLFTLSNIDVDTRSIEVTVDDVTYTLASTILTLGSSSAVYFLQLGNDNRYQIYFGDNVLGITPNHQSTILVRYRVASGAASNSARTFSVNGSIDGHSNVSVTTSAISTGGADSEDIESIRRNSSALYAARGRAVVASDYSALLQQQFPEITAINVFGGEVMNPPEYGKVFISVDIEGADGAPQSALDEYYQYIKTKSPITIQPVFISPSFLNLAFNIKVYYDYINYNVSESDIVSTVAAALTSYNDDYLNRFNVTFKHSHFASVIDDCHEAIISNDTSVQMVLMANTEILDSQTQKLYFNNELDPNLQPISSSTFSYTGLTCSLRDDRNGSLNIITNIQSSNPTTVTSIGTINYTSGELILDPIDFDSLNGAGLQIFARALSRNISAVKNTILKISSTNITITAIPITP